MLGYEPIFALPLLLVVSILCVYFALGFHFMLIASEQTCAHCGRAFSTRGSRELHEKVHETTVVRLPEVSKAAGYPKAA